MEKLDPRLHDEIVVTFHDYELAYELAAVYDNFNRTRSYILRRIERAIRAEEARPWREVLGTDTE